MHTLPYRPLLISAAEFAIKHLENLTAAPLSATSTLEDLRRRLRKEFPDAPLAPEQVVSDLVSDVEGGILGSAGGRFFAWAIGGSLPAALAADWLTSAWDQNAALYACAPAAAVVEEVAGEWLGEMMGLPRAASFAFVTGCQMAHTTCLAVARWELLNRKGWDVGQNGLSGAPPITVFASNRHGSIERAIRLLGIGERNIIDLPLDESERIRPETFDDLKPVKKFPGRKLAVARIWAAVQRLAGDSAQPARDVAPAAKPAKKVARKAPRRARARKTADESRSNKKAEVVAMLKRAKGVTLPEIMEHTGWQKHTVRGFISPLNGT